MVDKLLVVRSVEGQPVAGGEVASDLKASRVPIERTLSNAVITPTEGVRVSTLEKKGYLLSIKTVFPRPGAKVWYDDEREVPMDLVKSEMNRIPHASSGPVIQ